MIIYLYGKRPSRPASGRPLGYHFGTVSSNNNNNNKTIITTTTITYVLYQNYDVHLIYKKNPTINDNGHHKLALYPSNLDDHFSVLV